MRIKLIAIVVLIAGFVGFAKSATTVHAILPEYAAYTIIGQQVPTTTSVQCGAGTTLESYAGWLNPPTSTSSLFFTLDMCRAPLPTTGSIPMSGDIDYPGSGIPNADMTITGSITFLSADQLPQSAQCVYHYALYFAGQAYTGLSTQTAPPGIPDTGIYPPPGAMELDYYADSVNGTCPAPSGTGYVGGVVAIIVEA